MDTNVGRLDEAGHISVRQDCSDTQDLNRTLDGVDDADARMHKSEPVPVVTAIVGQRPSRATDPHVSNRGGVMNAPELIQTIEAAGGVLTLKGDRIRYELPEDAAAMVERLRQYRDEVLDVLRERERRQGGTEPSRPYAVALEKTTQANRRRCQEA